jgi:hypothetical protein
MSTQATSSGDARCPNCDAAINIPKSTRSIICHSCDAILKIVEREEKPELKVVGRSVSDDPTYQELSRQIEEVRAHLADLHADYQREVEKPFATSMRSVGWLGLLLALVALPALFYSGTIAAALAVVGVVIAVAGFAAHSSRAGARKRMLQEMTKGIERVAAQRDLLQRKAARIKTEV